MYLRRESEKRRKRVPVYPVDGDMIMGRVVIDIVHVTVDVVHIMVDIMHIVVDVVHIMVDVMHE